MSAKNLSSFRCVGRSVERISGSTLPTLNAWVAERLFQVN